MNATVPAVLYGRKDMTMTVVPMKDGTTHKHKLEVKTLEGRQVVVLDCKKCIAELVDRDPAIVTPVHNDPNATYSTHWAPTPRLVQKTEDEVQQEVDNQAAFAAGAGQQYADFLRWQTEQKKKGIKL